MRVMVTGGAGFIGSHLTDALVARGDQVVVIDDLSRGRAGRVHEAAKMHQGTVTDLGNLMPLFARFRPDLICHLAAQIDVRDSVTEPKRDAEANVLGTVSVLEAAREVGARVLFCSSGGALYGRDAPVPSHEDIPPLPESPYGVAKQSAELYVGLYNRLHNTRHGILRLANVYGPRQDPAGEAGVVAVFCARVLEGQPPTIYGDGRQTRDYVYVADVVDAFLAAAARDRPGIWNIGTGTEVSVLALAAQIGDVAGRRFDPIFAPLRPGELLRSSLASGRARSDLRWSAATPLAVGITRVYWWIASGKPERGMAAEPN